MNLGTLRLFCDIVRLRSFSRGARAHQISQSAASQAVQQLEEQLGVTLLDRRERPLALTPEGSIYYQGVRALVREYTKLESEIKAASSEIAGVVRVASIYSVGLYGFGEHMRRFMTEFPRAKVRLEYLRPNKVYEAVASEEADLGLLSYPQADRLVTAMPLRAERMVFVCAPSHRLAVREFITIADLDGEKLIAFESSLPIRKAIDRTLKEQHTHVTIAMEFDNIETIKQAVEMGVGVAILPEPTVRREAEARRVIAIPLPFHELVRPIGIIVRRHRSLSQTAQRFIDMLRSAHSPDEFAHEPQEQSALALA